MKRYNVILESLFEPIDKNVLWLKNKKIKQFTEGGWQDITSASNLSVDNEDLVEAGGEIKFADKKYVSEEFSGLGRVYLRKNISGGNNILTSDMLNQENTIYIIQYNYSLEGNTLEIPKNSVLQFEGGKISNGTLNFNNTLLCGDICIRDCDFYGVLKNVNINPSWFGFVPYDKSNSIKNYNILHSTLKLVASKDNTDNNYVEHCLIIDSGTFYIEGNNPLWLTRTEVTNLPGNSRYRNGIVIKGAGQYATTLVMLNNSEEEYWFGNNDDPNYPAPERETGSIQDSYNTSVFSYVVIEGITFKSEYDIWDSGYKNIKVSGFYWRSYGWEKFVTIRNCNFFGVNIGFQCEGYGNADHNRWYNCSFTTVKTAFLFNNNQSVANALYGTDCSSLRDFIQIGEYGGGDLYVSSAAIQLYSPKEEDGSYTDTEGAIIHALPVSLSSGIGRGESNTSYELHHVRLESYGKKKRVLYTEGSNYGRVYVSFYDSSFVIQKSADNTQILKDNSLIKIDGRNILCMFRCYLKPCNIEVRNYSSLIFRDCNYNSEPNTTNAMGQLRDCCICDYNANIQCTGLNTFRMFNSDKNLFGCTDFSMGSFGAGEYSCMFNIQDPSELSPSYRIFVMPNIYITKVSLEKLPYPEEDIDDSNEYGIKLNYGDTVLLETELFHDSDVFLKEVTLSNPILVSNYPNNAITTTLKGTPHQHSDKCRVIIRLHYSTK